MGAHRLHRLRRASHAHKTVTPALRGTARLDRRRRIRGRDRGVQPAARSRVHPTGDLLRVAAAWPARRARRRRGVHRPGADRHPRPRRPVLRERPTEVGPRRRGRRRRRGRGRRGAGRVEPRAVQLGAAQPPPALGGLPARRRCCGRDHRPLARAGAARLRPDRTHRPLPRHVPCRRAPHQSVAASGRQDSDRRGAAQRRLGRVQGRRALLRRRVRDHPAHAGRRSRSLSLDERRPVPQRRRTRADHARAGRADRRRGGVRRGRPRWGAAGRGGRLRSLVRLPAAGRVPLRPRPHRCTRPRLPRRRRPRRHWCHPRLGHSPGRCLDRILAVRRPRGRRARAARPAPRRRPHLLAAAVAGVVLTAGGLALPH